MADSSPNASTTDQLELVESTADSYIYDENYGNPLLHLLQIDLCSQAIFYYVPIKDLVRSEQVSKGWRQIIQHYLINYCSVTYTTTSDKWRLFGDTNHILKYSLYSPHFTKAIEKLGSCITRVVLNYDEPEILRIIAKNCCNLQVTDFKWVKARTISDFFKHLNSNSLRYLKSLAHYDLTEIYLSTQQARNIKQLHLGGNPINVITYNEMVALEELSFQNASCDFDEEFEFIDCIKRLPNLKRFYAGINNGVNNALLEALAQCRKLEYIDIVGCDPQCCARGVMAVCRRAPPSVTTLCFDREMNFDTGGIITDGPFVRALVSLGCMTEQEWTAAVARTDPWKHPIELRIERFEYQTFSKHEIKIRLSL